ncbi:hypothetical protein [Pseudoclavibacter sp. VKM Ac-2867]|uniref:hypothetical protein n=1 Tax=Pseudoclavibacter sp. VKM Ac-2867 TaxID=2783829 RepID=UPI00188C231E|nr:hypothetical protein [Pseudoclavibacter sp. VKM Ac-2867]MBF4458321.1 hypothetical protein [Pseudoclavibacter sp. VKM Ac-2867]
MTTPSQWNGQHSPDPQSTAAQGASGYGTPPSGTPSAYGPTGQAPSGQAPSGQGYGQASGDPQQPGGYQQSGGYAQPGGYQQPGSYAQPGEYAQPGGYQQPGNPQPAKGPSRKQLATFASLREELSFSTNLFGMISLASALGGWVLTTFLSFVMSVLARTGGYEIYGVLSPANGILQLLTSVAAIVFGILALRSSGWRNMPASVGSVVGVITLVPTVFFFLIGLIPFSY